MAWKQRRDRSYFYHSVRMGGSVATLYAGAGRDAELICALITHERMKRLDDREALRATAEAAEPADRAVEDLCRRVEALARGALEAGGYHRPGRGRWRRRRGMALHLSPEIRAEDEPMRAELVKVFTDRDPKAAAALLRRLEGDPDRLIRLALGEAAHHAFAAVAHQFRPSNPLTVAALITRAGRVREALAGPGATALEVLLAERCALCWLDVHVLDVQAAETEHKTLGQAEFADRRRDRAHRRYVTALRSLAQVRRLLSPGAPAVNVLMQQCIGVNHVSHPQESENAT